MTIGPGSPTDETTSGPGGGRSCWPWRPPRAGARRLPVLAARVLARRHGTARRSPSSSGPATRRSLASTCEAVLRSGPGRTCAAVVAGPPAATRHGGFHRPGRRAHSAASGRASRATRASRPASPRLRRRDGRAPAHLALRFRGHDVARPGSLARRCWRPGAVVVVTTTASDVSSPYAEMKRQVTDAYPAVSISLGPTVEAVVAQTPERRRHADRGHAAQGPFAVGAFLALLGEQIELHHLLHDEPEPSEAVRALIGRVIDQQHAERRRVPRRAPGLQGRDRPPLGGAGERPGASSAQQIEAARREREHLVAEFLDRVDELSAKVSTTASRARGRVGRHGRAPRGRGTQGRGLRRTGGHRPERDRRHPAARRRGGSPRPSACSHGCSPGGPCLRRSPRTEPDAALATESDPFCNNVSVIVLNYNQAATTVECLDALAAARSDLIREIIVVDNGSDAEELAILRQRHRAGRLRPRRGRREPVLRRRQQHRRRLRRRRLHRLPQQRRLRAARLDRGAELDHAERSGRRRGGTDVPLPRRPGPGGGRHRRADRRRRSRSAREPSGARTTTTRRAWSTSAPPPAS